MNSALADALKLLVKSERFEAELRAQLLQMGHPEMEVAQSIERLQEWGVLSDLRAETVLVEGHLAKSGRGRFKLAQKYARHGIEPEDAISRAAEQVPDELERLRALEFLASHPQLENESAKAYRKLMSRGFDPEVAAEAVESFCRSAD